jgi:acyl-CoA thioesterase
MKRWGELVREMGGISRAIDRIKASGEDPVEFFNRYFLEVEPVYRFIGVRIRELGQGYAKVVFDMRDEIKRWGGIVNGGVIMTVIDMVIGVAIMTINDGIDQYTAELKVNFLEPMRIGPFTAIGRVIRRGRTLAVGEAEVFDGNNVLCAKGIGTWFLVRRRDS